MFTKMLNVSFCREVFLDRIQTQEEIHRLIEEVFGERKRISLEEFQQINEEVSSEMFLSVISLSLRNVFYLDYDFTVIISTMQ